MICENSASGTGRIINPRCWKGKVTTEVIVRYNVYEKETLYLCAECAKAVKKDARRHGFRASVKNI